MTTTTNCRGVPRTLSELEEEYNVLARLHQQHCNAFGRADHPLVLKVESDMTTTRAALARLREEVTS